MKPYDLIMISGKLIITSSMLMVTLIASPCSKSFYEKIYAIKSQLLKNIYAKAKP